MTQPTEHELWAQAAAGSDAAFGVLFELHASAVYNYCFRRTGDWAVAEDLMAATFLEAWRKKERVRLSGDSLRPWLLGVATNLLRNYRRSARRRSAALEKVKTEISYDGMADDAAARIDDERRMRELLERIARMPLKHREVIALVLWSELSYEEAAVALGVAVGTVKSRLARARRSLMEPTERNGHDSGESNALARASVNQPKEVKG